MKPLYSFLLQVRAHESGQFVVWASPDSLGLSMQGGPGLEKALADWVAYAKDLAAMLVKEEHRLGPDPQRQLAWLRAHGFVKESDERSRAFR